MPLFRFIKSDTLESFKTIVEVNSSYELLDKIREYYRDFDVTTETLKIEFYVDDNGIWEKTYIVSIKDKDGYHAVGLLNSDLKKYDELLIKNMNKNISESFKYKQINELTESLNKSLETIFYNFKRKLEEITK